MKRLMLIVAAALVLPAAAFAKGPSEALVTGPGLDSSGLAISLSGDDADLTNLSGFFPASFGQSPDPMLSAAPRGTLGPRYTITYTVPGENGDSTIVQDVYPYAHPRPVTYTRPGQTFFGGLATTQGGWYVSSAGLRNVLVHAGLPAESPVADTGGEGGRTLWPWVAGALALLAALGCAAWFARARSTSTIRTPSVS